MNCFICGKHMDGELPFPVGLLQGKAYTLCLSCVRTYLHFRPENEERVNKKSCALDFGGYACTCGLHTKSEKIPQVLKKLFSKKDLSHAMMEAGAFINRNRDKTNVLELITTLKNGEWEIVVSYTEK